MKNLPISWQSGFGESSDWPPGTFLSQMPPELQEAVLGMGDRKSFLRGEVLIQEDARDTDVILLRTGAAKVTSCLGRRVTLLGVRVAGEVVGEMAASDGSPRSATVTACSAVEATGCHRRRVEPAAVSRPCRVAGATADRQSSAASCQSLEGCGECRQRQDLCGARLERARLRLRPTRSEGRVHRRGSQPGGTWLPRRIEGKHRPESAGRTARGPRRR